MVVVTTEQRQQQFLDFREVAVHAEGEELPFCMMPGSNAYVPVPYYSDSVPA